MYVLLALFSGLGLALVLASGSLVQAITVAFFSGHTSSLYDGENVAQYLNAKTYIETALWPPYLATGLIAAAAMIQASTKRAVLARGTIAIGTSLTVIDAFAVGAQGIMISALCNYTAGFLLAIFTLILALNAHVVRHLSSSIRVERALWILWPFFGYVILTGLLFFILSVLTTIPSTPTSFRLEPPLNGYYVTSEIKGCESSKTVDEPRQGCQMIIDTANKEDISNQDVFSVLGKFTGVDNGAVEFIGEGDGLIFKWTKGISGSVTGALWVTQGCVKKEQLEEAMTSEPIFRGELRNLRIALDEGLSEFQVIEPKHHKIEITDDNIAQFMVTPSKENTDSFQVSRFLGSGVIRSFESFEGAIYALTVTPLKESGKGVVQQSRRITYTINGADSQNLDINMESKLISPEAVMTCEGLPTQNIEGGLSSLASTFYITIVVSIDPPKLLNLENANRSNYATVSEANGWISSRGHPQTDLHETIVSGKLSQLSLIGSVQELVIDGHSVATGETSTLQLSGILEGRTAGPAILMEGTVDYLILNGKRLTTTRWEKLDAGVRIPIILGVPAAVLFLLNFVVSTLRRRAQKVWLRPDERVANK